MTTHTNSINTAAEYIAANKIKNSFYKLVFDQAKAEDQSVESREQTIVDYAVENRISGEDLNTALLLFRSYMDTIDSSVDNDYDDVDTTVLHTVPEFFESVEKDDAAKSAANRRSSARRKLLVGVGALGISFVLGNVVGRNSH